MNTSGLALSPYRQRMSKKPSRKRTPARPEFAAYGWREDRQRLVYLETGKPVGTDPIPNRRK